MPETVLYTLCDSAFYGTQRNVLSTARRLDPARYRPVVAAPRREPFFRLLEAAGVETFDIPFKKISDALSAAALGRLIRRRNVKLVHAHLGVSTFLSLAAASLTGVPVIATRHFIEDRYTTIRSPFLFKTYRGVYSRMNSRLKRVIFVSEAVRRAIESREGGLGGRGIVIPNGVDLLEGPLKEELSPEDLESARDRLGVPPGVFLAVTLSRLAPEKGLDTLVRAAALLKNSEKFRFLFLVAGEGPLRGALERQARELAVHDSVRFAGYITDARELLAAADAFVLCAHAEPFGISILEAMAAGIPAVITGAGGPLEIITDHESGLFFEPGDASGLAAQLVRLASDIELRARLVRGARERVTVFDERGIALRIQQVYDEVIGSNVGK